MAQVRKRNERFCIERATACCFRRRSAPEPNGLVPPQSSMGCCKSKVTTEEFDHEAQEAAKAAAERAAKAAEEARARAEQIWQDRAYAITPAPEPTR